MDIENEKSEILKDDPNAAPLAARTERNMISLRLFMGTSSFALLFLILLIMAAAVS